MATQGFTVLVGERELLRPDKSTPHELKYLSNVDDQSGLRNHIPFIHIYPGSSGFPGDPTSTLRRAVARALVHYYPLAGRLRNADGGKLVVDCCNGGTVFREATANVTLNWLRTANGGNLQPPFPQLDRLLVDDVWGCNLITDSPLLRMQVTRFVCGGSALAYTFNHCTCDAFGALQFVTAVAEFAREPTRLTPTALPVWGRETLKPRRPPIVSYPHPEYDTRATPPATESDFKRLVQASSFFTREDVSALKRRIDGDQCPTFDAVASCLWRARTRALTLATDDNVKIGDTARLLFPIDTRSRHRPALPKGYYGSAVVFPCAAAPASEIRDRPIRHAASLISALKSLAAGEGYRDSVVDFLESNGRPGFVWEGAFVVSDMSRLRFADVDFGWGRAVYGGPARAGTGVVPGMVTSVVGYRREDDGVEGLLALVSLPRETLERFEGEVRAEIKRGEGFVDGFTHDVVGRSAL